MDRRARLRSLSLRTIVALAATHGVLFAAIAQGGLPYASLLVLLVAELLLIHMATLAVYRAPSPPSPVGRVLKAAATLLVLLLILLLAYGMVAAERNGDALAAVARGFARTDGVAMAWAGLYLLVHAGASLWQALAAPKPRVAWASQTLLDGNATFAALLLMLFACLVLGVFSIQPTAGVGVLDLWLAGLLVFFRFASAVLASAFPIEELERAAARDLGVMPEDELAALREMEARKSQQT